jgi:transposase-like protein
MSGVMITDTLASNGAVKRETLPSVKHWQHQRLNNGAETGTTRCASMHARCDAARHQAMASAS